MEGLTALVQILLYNSAAPGPDSWGVTVTTCSGYHLLYWSNPVHHLPVDYCSNICNLKVNRSFTATCMPMLLMTYYRSLRRNEHGKLLINMSISLICLYVIFMIAGLVTSVEVLCGLVSALFQYFMLVFFGWTAAEAVNLYYKLVRVLGKPVEHYVLKAALIVWCEFKHNNNIMVVIIFITEQLCTCTLPNFSGSCSYCDHFCGTRIQLLCKPILVG